MSTGDDNSNISVSKQKQIMNKNFIYQFNFNEPMKLTIVLEQQEEGGFTAFVPSLPGCISEGDTKEEAIRNIKEAIELYLEPDTNDLIEFTGEVVQIAV